MEDSQTPYMILRFHYEIPKHFHLPSNRFSGTPYDAKHLKVLINVCIHAEGNLGIMCILTNADEMKRTLIKSYYALTIDLIPAKPKFSKRGLKVRRGKLCASYLMLGQCGHPMARL